MEPRGTLARSKGFAGNLFDCGAESRPVVAGAVDAPASRLLYLKPVGLGDVSLEAVSVVAITVMPAVPSGMPADAHGSRPLIGVIKSKPTLFWFCHD